MTAMKYGYPAATTTAQIGSAARAAKARSVTAYHGWTGDAASSSVPTTTAAPTGAAGRRCHTHTAAAASASAETAPAIPPGIRSAPATRYRPAPS
jgi:hypothetical protein